MPQIHISVRDKVARAARRTPSIVCGNADYEIVFDFDSEWDAHDQKIARFIWGGAYYDVPFMGNVCPVPTVVYASEVEVGVYAGNLRTTTPATIACRRSVRSDPSLPINDQALVEYEHRAVAAAAEAQSAATEAKEAATQAQESAKTATAVQALVVDTGIKVLYAELGAQKAQTAAEQAAAQAAQSAEQMSEHASTTRTRYSFTVGQPDELDYMTPESCGIYNDFEKLRYNDKTLFTIYRYPLTDSARITSAVWHAHLAQQTLLQVSSDNKTWITLRDNGSQQLGSQYHYELCNVLDLTDAEALYVKIADSYPLDGFGGAILADIPVTLDITHGTLSPFALPSVSTDDEGSYLRVIGGRWCTADTTTLTSRVRTYSFIVGGLNEAKYLQNGSTGILNESCRFNDRTAHTLYRYHIANSALVRRVTWTATLGQQLRLECSSDGEDWITLLDAGTLLLPMERRTFDLTDKLNLLAFDEIYIRISDSDTSDGFGGSIARAGGVNLHVERCEPPIYL